jgi:hypothetical protein
MKPKIIMLALAILGAAGCSKAGLGQGVRDDIVARMQTVQEPIAACYKTALEKNRKLRGQIVVQFSAAPKTGAFENVTVVRDDLADEGVKSCVVEQVGALKLAMPQSTAVSATYPLDFAPNK